MAGWLADHTRRVSANSVVAYSTTIRAGRSVRLQTVARPAVTSPAEVPLGIPGRAPSEVTKPGARPPQLGSHRARWGRP